MVGPLVASLIYHPLLLLFCHSISRHGLEEALPPAAHFALCGDWLGVKTAVAAARNSSGATSWQLWGGLLADDVGGEYAELVDEYEWEEDDDDEERAASAGEAEEEEDGRRLQLFRTEPPDAQWSINGYSMQVLSGDCRVEETAGGYCMTSPGFPFSYSNDDSCQVSVAGPTATGAGTCCADFEAYDVEDGFDTLKIRWMNPRTVVTYLNSRSFPLDEDQQYLQLSDNLENRIEWETDASVTKSGFKLCWTDEQNVRRRRTGSGRRRQVPGTYNTHDRGDFEHDSDVEEGVWWILIIFYIILPFFGSVTMHVGTQACSVCCYQSGVKALRQAAAPKLQDSVLQAGPYSLANAPGRDFKVGLCDCCSDCVTLLHILFFPLARIADTQEAALGSNCCCLFVIWTSGVYMGSVGDFFLLLSTRHLFSFPVIVTIYLSQLLVALYSMGKRGAIRTKFGGDSSGGKCCIDFLLWWCCMECTAVQEARTVDQASNLQMECCCKLSPVGGALQGVAGAVVVGAPAAVVVGQPVYAQAMPQGVVVAPVGTVQVVAPVATVQMAAVAQPTQAVVVAAVAVPAAGSPEQEAR